MGSWNLTGFTRESLARTQGRQRKPTWVLKRVFYFVSIFSRIPVLEGERVSVSKPRDVYESFSEGLAVRARFWACSPLISLKWACQGSGDPGEFPRGIIVKLACLEVTGLFSRCGLILGDFRLARRTGLLSEVRGLSISRLETQLLPLVVGNRC